MQAELELAGSDEEKDSIIKEYPNWEWTYPQGIIDKREKEKQKKRLKKRIEELQEAYDKLDDGE